MTMTREEFRSLLINSYAETKSEPRERGDLA